MATREIARRDHETVEALLTGFADGEAGSPLLPATQNARVSLARAQEDAAIEAQDVLSQADEALVLG